MSFDIINTLPRHWSTPPGVTTVTERDSAETLHDELRRYLLDSVSRSSGHFASGLGTVELTVALHYVYNTPFDANLGCWTGLSHKILTGRRDKAPFSSERRSAPVPVARRKRKYDVLSVGHSSHTSIASVSALPWRRRKKVRSPHRLCSRRRRATSPPVWRLKQ